MKKFSLVTLILAFSLTTPLFAVKVSNLYQADVSVSSQASDERAQAITDGFAQVLIKLSGNPDIDKNPVIKEGLQRSDYYVQEYSYSAVTEASAEYLLKISYNKFDVNKLLKNAGIIYWGEKRPLILVWLAVTDNHTPAEVISSDSPGNVYDVMQQQGKKYGLPLIFPVMDMTEINDISANDVTEMSLPVLKAAAKRYSPEALLIGKMDIGGSGVKSQWLLIWGSNQWGWTVTDTKPDFAIASILNQITQTLSKHYLAKVEQDQHIWIGLEVINVIKATELTQLVQSLKQLTPVREVRLLQVSGDVVELSLRVHGSLATFQQSVAINKHLDLKAQDGNKLYYAWH